MVGASQLAATESVAAIIDNRDDDDDDPVTGCRERSTTR